MAFDWETLDKIRYDDYIRIKNNIDLTAYNIGFNQFNWQREVNQGDEVEANDVIELREAIDYLDDQNYCALENTDKWTGKYDSRQTGDYSIADDAVDGMEYSSVDRTRNSNYDNGDESFYNGDNYMGRELNEDNTINESDHTTFRGNEDQDEKGDHDGGVESDRDSHHMGTQNSDVKSTYFISRCLSHYIDNWRDKTADCTSVFWAVDNAEYESHYDYHYRSRLSTKLYDIS